MKKRIATVLITILVVLLILACAWIAFIQSGAYNISTSNHDNKVINWALDKGTTRSIVRHAKGINAPPLTDPAMVQKGFKHFKEMCVLCHGAPGIKPDEIAKGLWPVPPNLGMATSDWTPAQLFWIIKNGIKFTAMPAWGPTHSDQQIWAMVAFLEKLPNLSAAEYHAMETNSPAKSQSDEHGAMHKDLK